MQEPKTQAMRLQCFDHDALNVTVRNTPESPAQATLAHSPSCFRQMHALLQATLNPEHFSVAHLGREL